MQIKGDVIKTKLIFGTKRRRQANELSEDALGTVAGGYEVKTVYRDPLEWMGPGHSSLYSVTGENKITGETETKLFRSRSDAKAYGEASLK